MARRISGSAAASACAIEIVEGSFLEHTEWTEGDVVVCNNICFGEETTGAIVELVKAMRPGALLLLTKVRADARLTVHFPIFD